MIYYPQAIQCTRSQRFAVEAYGRAIWLYFLTLNNGVGSHHIPDYVGKIEAIAHLKPRTQVEYICAVVANQYYGFPSLFRFFNRSNFRLL